MPRRPTVRVQMAEEPDQLEALVREELNAPPRKKPFHSDDADAPGLPDSDPAIPSDYPTDAPDFDDKVDPESDPAYPYPTDIPADPRPAALATDMPNQLRTYRSRIRVVEAWQYLGSLAHAPKFVSRDWVSYAPYDPVANLEPGPALRVPLAGSSSEKLARVGDYIVRQEITLVDGLEAEEQVDVWSKDEFERLFIPAKTSSAAKAPVPNRGAVAEDRAEPAWTE